MAETIAPASVENQSTLNKTNANKISFFVLSHNIEQIESVPYFGPSQLFNRGTYCKEIESFFIPVAKQ